VIQGEVFDVAVDMRSDSPTFGKWAGEVLSADNGHQMYVPAGFAHGFLVLSDTVDFVYKCSDFYAPGDEYGVIWNDPDIGIEWPDAGELLVSEKDAILPRFADAKYF
jgi:dTDP-4-dehydrorhamnose 3,5-epimerase